MPMDPCQNAQTNGPWTPGMEVLANYNFPGNSHEDLPFKKGDILFIVRSTRDPNWYRARDGSGHEGMIPATYVQPRTSVPLHAMPWYHGRMTREEAERLLKFQEDGVFLIRDSVHYHGDYTLSVVFEGRVDHYRVLARNRRLEVDGGDCSFNNLMELVQLAYQVLTESLRLWVHDDTKDTNYILDEEKSFLSCLNYTEYTLTLFIPSALASRIVRTLHRWFHGKISRQRAEELLKPPEDGLFLIRESSNYPGDYTLCVCHGSKVEHYRILFHKNRLTVDEEGYFRNLSELVQHYKKDADGLCTRLVRPVKKDGESFATVSVQDFKSSGWVIKMDNRSEWENIGKGEFGNVYKGMYNGQPVAIKQLKDKDKAEQTFLREASVMTSLKHPKLVQLIGVVVDEEFFLVTEFMGKGNLVEYLRSRGRSVITKKDQINYATDTCEAMDYLESKNLVHRDLAARNVLVHDNGIAKVSDFGLAKFEDFSTDGGKFPIKWTAPEALRSNTFTNKSDMWSFGILLWEIYSFGRVPYPRIPLADVVMHVERGYRMEAPEGCPPEIYEIMKDAWAIKSDERPTFHQVLEKLNILKSVKV